eukprot:3163930-Prymnesium_polylepis.1
MHAVPCEASARSAYRQFTRKDDRRPARRGSMRCLSRFCHTAREVGEGSFASLASTSSSARVSNDCAAFARKTMS